LADPQVYYYTGPPGPPGPYGPPGKPGNLNDTATSFAYAQLAHVIKQIIKYYPTTNMKVYDTGVSYSEGVPSELYSSPDGTYGGLFVITEPTDTAAMPLQSITVIELEAGTAYNPSMTYIPKPTFPEGCDTNIITAIHDYLSINTPVTIYTASATTVTGIVYKNAYGMLVIADDTTGNNPVFIPVTKIRIIVTN